MQSFQIELILRLDGNETHVLPFHGFGNRFRIAPDFGHLLEPGDESIPRGRRRHIPPRLCRRTIGARAILQLTRELIATNRASTLLPHPTAPLRAERNPPARISGESRSRLPIPASVSCEVP